MIECDVCLERQFMCDYSGQCCVKDALIFWNRKLLSFERSQLEHTHTHCKLGLALDMATILRALLAITAILQAVLLLLLAEHYNYLSYKIKLEHNSFNFSTTINKMPILSGMSLMRVQFVTCMYCTRLICN